mmetsp:Transcript_46842/g.134061  ORF Transcript_46842/g.134061 Transcript_46842/m.134061 type:complete len:209 (+) Transcript_46842:726-1352(+)
MARAADGEAEDRPRNPVGFLHRAGQQEHAHHASHAGHVLHQLRPGHHPGRVPVRQHPPAAHRLVRPVRRGPRRRPPRLRLLARVHHAHRHAQGDRDRDAGVHRRGPEPGGPVQRPALREPRRLLRLGRGRHRVHAVHAVGVREAGERHLRLHPLHREAAALQGQLHRGLEGRDAAAHLRARLPRGLDADHRQQRGRLSARLDPRPDGV